MKSKEEIVREPGKNYLIVLGIIHGICLAVVVSSPFIWMWIDWSLAWRVGLSGLLTAIVCAAIYNFVKKTIREVVAEDMEKTNPNKPSNSRSKQKLEEAMDASSRAKDTKNEHNYRIKT